MGVGHNRSIDGTANGGDSSAKEHRSEVAVGIVARGGDLLLEVFRASGADHLAVQSKVGFLERLATRLAIGGAGTGELRLFKL